MHKQCPECRHIGLESDFKEVEEPPPYIPPPRPYETGCGLKEALEIVRKEGLSK